MFATNLIIVFLTLASIFAKESGLFKRFLIHGNRWSKFAYSRSEFRTKNPLECGSLCLINVDCELYALHNNNCYLGNFDSDTGYLDTPPSSRDKVYVDIDKVAGMFGNFFVIPKVDDSSVWGQYIFKNETMLPTETEQDCAFLCSIVESINGCQLFPLWVSFFLSPREISEYISLMFICRMINVILVM